MSIMFNQICINEYVDLLSLFDVIILKQYNQKLDYEAM